jgi:uncharacterized protein YpmB
LPDDPGGGIVEITDRASTRAEDLQARRIVMAINRMVWLAFVGASVLAAYPAVSQDVRPKEEGKEQAIDVSLEQARKTLNGEITNVYLVEMEGQQVYELEGTDAQNVEMAVYVSSDGNILKTEKEGEEEGEGKKE